MNNNRISRINVQWKTSIVASLILIAFVNMFLNFPVLGIIALLICGVCRFAHRN